MAWTDEMVEQLRAMWKEGLTTGEIGKRLGVSKNSIVGKVHRLGLSGRPSPIKKKDDSETSAENTSKAAPKAVKESKEKAAKENSEPKTEKTEKPAAKENAPQPKAEVKAEAPSVPHRHNGKTGLTDLDNHTCRWPLGDPKDESFHFCGKKVRIGQTYCDEHANVAYVKTNKK